MTSREYRGRRPGDRSRPSQPFPRRPDTGSSPWNIAGQSPSGEPSVSVPRPFRNGRQLAYAVLQEYDQSDRFVQDVFAEFDRTHQLSSADRGLAVDVAAGVVRRSRTLDVLIESRLTRPRHNVEPDLWRVLRLGAWQVVFARTPEHAAVDTAVELCRDLNRPRWTGFVNGILRNLLRLLSPEPAEAPSPTSLPVAHGLWRSLNEGVFVDPYADRTRYFADAFSLPMFLATRWNERMSETDLLRTCFQSITPPAVTLRVNSLRAQTADVMQSLAAAGIVATEGQIPGSLHVDQSSQIDSWPGYAEGHWSVQDEAAMSASLLLAPKPEEQILDLCAAPGGKTTHLAELSGDQAIITACDVADGRLQRIRDNAARLELTSIRTLAIGKDGNGIPDGPFDAVLVDVPCSNSGVLNRRPEARWRIDEASIQELVILQTRLLLLACERVRPGGRVVYSTCSLEPEENRGVVDAVLQHLPQFSLRQNVLHLPGQPADGAYQALLERSPVK
jgi:16S rRNA (cytosine967-C5)-methyltransferase